MPKVKPYATVIALRYRTCKYLILSLACDMGGRINDLTHLCVECRNEVANEAVTLLHVGAVRLDACAGLSGSALPSVHLT